MILECIEWMVEDAQQRNIHTASNPRLSCIALFPFLLFYSVWKISLSFCLFFNAAYALFVERAIKFNLFNVHFFRCAALSTQTMNSICSVIISFSNIWLDSHALEVNWNRWKRANKTSCKKARKKLTQHENKFVIRQQHNTIGIQCSCTNGNIHFWSWVIA